MELSQVVIQGDDPVSWTSSWGWVNCSLETCGKRWNHGFSSQFLSLRASVSSLSSWRFYPEAAPSAPSTAGPPRTPSAPSVPETPSAVAVGLNGTESPSSEPSVLKGESDGRKDGWIIRWIWIWISIKTHRHLSLYFWISQNFHPNQLGQTWKFSFWCCGRPESSCTTVTPTCFGIFGGEFSKTSKETQEIDGDLRLMYN